MLHDDGKERQIDEIWEQINELIEHVNALSLAVEELQRKVSLIHSNERGLKHQLNTTEKPKRATKRTTSRSKKSDED